MLLPHKSPAGVKGLCAFLSECVFSVHDPVFVYILISGLLMTHAASPERTTTPTATPVNWELLHVCFCVYVQVKFCSTARLLPFSQLPLPWRPRLFSLSHWHLESFRDIRAVLTVNKFPLGETKRKGKFSGNGELWALSLSHFSWLLLLLLIPFL